jgi:hypothetical protein
MSAASHKHPLSAVGVVFVMVAPNAWPMSSADGAEHPRAWKEALPELEALALPVVVDVEPPELEAADADDWVVLVLPVALELFAVVLELFDVDPPHADSVITNRQLSAHPATRFDCIGQNPMTFIQCVQRIGAIRGSLRELRWWWRRHLDAPTPAGGRSDGRRLPFGCWRVAPEGSSERTSALPDAIEQGR